MPSVIHGDQLLDLLRGHRVWDLASGLRFLLVVVETYPVLVRVGSYRKPNVFSGILTPPLIRRLSMLTILPLGKVIL